MKPILSRSETLEILKRAFEQNLDRARRTVLADLQEMGCTEPQLFDAIEEYAKGLNLVSDQWLRVFQMYPSQIFRSRFDLGRLLSESDQRKLEDHDRGAKL